MLNIFYSSAPYQDWHARVFHQLIHVLIADPTCEHAITILIPSNVVVSLQISLLERSGKNSFNHRRSWIYWASRDRGPPHHHLLEHHLPGQAWLLREPQQDSRHADAPGQEDPETTEVCLCGPEVPSQWGIRPWYREGWLHPPSSCWVSRGQVCRMFQYYSVWFGSFTSCVHHLLINQIQQPHLTHNLV